MPANAICHYVTSIEVLLRIAATGGMNFLYAHMQRFASVFHFPLFNSVHVFAYRLAEQPADLPPSRRPARGIPRLEKAERRPTNLMTRI